MGCADSLNVLFLSHWSSIVSNVEKINSSEGKKLWIVGEESQKLGNVFGRDTLYYMCRA